MKTSSSAAEVLPVHFLSLEPEGFGQINFSSVPEVLDWVQAERNFWNWATRNMAAEIGVNDHARRDYFLQRLNLASSEFSKLAHNPHDHAALEAAKQAIQEYAASGLVAEGARAQFIAGLRELPDGDVVAQSALSAFLGEVQPKTNGAQPVSFRYPSLRGRMSMVMFDAGVASGSFDSARKAIRSIGSQNARALLELKAANEAQLSMLTAASQQIQTTGAETLQQHSLQVHAALERFDAKMGAIVEACEKAHERYTTAMEIQGPVEYWNEKHEAHKKAAWWWGMGLLIYTVAGIVILVLAVCAAYNYASANVATSYTHTDFVISASVALLITVVFWIARFITRLYLSERHMAIDAKLRSVMAKTYLALASNKQVADADRALVLAPLFRAGTDGLIKEETGLDSGLAMISRALEKTAK